MATLQRPSDTPALSQRNLLPPPCGDDRNVWLGAGPARARRRPRCDAALASILDTRFAEEAIR